MPFSARFTWPWVSAFGGKFGGTELYSFHYHAEKVGNVPWRHVKEYWWSPKAHLETPILSCNLSFLSPLHLCVSHSANHLPPSLCPSVFLSLGLSLLLCYRVFSQAPGRLPLDAAIWRSCLRADRCCVPSQHHQPPTNPTPPPQTKPSSVSLSSIALPPLCAWRSSQLSMADLLWFIWHALCP